MEIDQLFIDGRLTASDGSQFADIVNPATEDIVGRAPMAVNSDVDRAVAAARRAFDRGSWPRLDLQARADAIERLAEAIDSRIDTIASIVTREVGTPISQTRQGQGQGYLRFCVDWARGRDGLVEPRVGAVTRGLVRWHPVGVSALIVPWNSPFSLLMQKLGPALLAGCTVVIKPAPQTSLDAYVLAEMAMECGIPPGVINIVPADAEIGTYLVGHPGIDKISFTGSTRAGRQIAQIAGASFKRLTLELGGKSASVVLHDADLEAAVVATADAILRNGGQTCSALSRLIVSADSVDSVVDLLRARMYEYRLGDPMEEETTLGPVVSERQRQGIEDHIANAVSQGASVLMGGRRPDGFDRGWWIEPTIVSAENTMDIAQEEVFGPVLCVIGAKDDDEAVALAGQTRYGLAAAVWSTDAERAAEVAQRMRVGTVTVNGFVHDPGLPFGGFGESGLGRACGTEGIEAFVEVQTVNLPG